MNQVTFSQGHLLTAIGTNHQTVTVLSNNEAELYGILDDAVRGLRARSHHEEVEIPTRRRCECRCSCRKRPGRLIPCRVCDARVGPGCCATAHVQGWPDTICHLCAANPQDIDEDARGLLTHRRTLLRYLSSVMVELRPPRFSRCRVASVGEYLIPKRF